MYTPIVKDLHHTLCFGTNCIKNVKFKRKNIDDFERDLSSNISDILNEMFRNKKELLTQKNHKRDDIGKNQRLIHFKVLVTNLIFLGSVLGCSFWNFPSNYIFPVLY